MGPLNTPNPSSNGGMDFGPSQLAGGAPPDPGQSPDMSGPPVGIGQSPDAQSNALQAVVELVRGMEQGLTGLAQQFPTAAPEIRRAVDAVRAVLQRIVSSPGQDMEPPAPQSLA